MYILEYAKSLSEISVAFTFTIITDLVLFAHILDFLWIYYYLSRCLLSIFCFAFLVPCYVFKGV